MTRSHSGLFCMRTGNPDLTTNTRSCRTSVSELGWEVRSPKLWPSTFNSEILHTHPRITSSETVVSIHHEMAVLGKIPSAFLFTVSTALHSRINVYGYKPPNIYWALKQYLASSEKNHTKKARDWRTWRIRQWKWTEASWQHIPS